MASELVESKRFGDEEEARPDVEMDSDVFDAGAVPAICLAASCDRQPWPGFQPVTHCRTRVNVTDFSARLRAGGRF